MIDAGDLPSPLPAHAGGECRGLNAVLQQQGKRDACIIQDAVH